VKIIDWIRLYFRRRCPRCGSKSCGDAKTLEERYNTFLRRLNGEAEDHKREEREER
jgi:hypothetical protein